MPKSKQASSHLHIVNVKGEPMDAASLLDPASDPGPLPEDYQEQPKHDAASVIGNAVMYAAMSWVACCLEKTAESVEVTPLGGGVFDAVVKMENAQEFWLRVLLDLQGGSAPRLRTTVEPLHP